MHFASYGLKKKVCAAAMVMVMPVHSVTIVQKCALPNESWVPLVPLVLSCA